MTAVEVADAVGGYHVSWIYSNWKDLAARTGFPSPLPRLHPKARLIWMRRHIEAWLNGQRFEPQTAANDRDAQKTDAIADRLARL
jgi:hypothetical protein